MALCKLTFDENANEYKLVDINDYMIQYTHPVVNLLRIVCLTCNRHKMIKYLEIFIKDRYIYKNTDNASYQMGPFNENL